MSDPSTTPPAPAPVAPRRWYEHPWLLGAAVGLGYTVPMRLLFSTVLEGKVSAREVVGAMSVAFLAVVPAATGALAVYFAGRRSPVSVWGAITLPWAACWAAILVAMLTLIEGSICIVLAAPLFLCMASVGGLVMRALMRWRSKPDTMVAVALLPLAFGGVEGQVACPREAFVVENVRVVDAPPEVVWRHVASVPAIAPAELPWSFSHAIGLPRPIEATLDAQAVGGVRRAIFDRGLVFREEVTDWQPGRTIAFSIAPEQAPAEALDEHVVVGGRYFDVTDGRYVLHDLGDGRTRLELSSTHRLATTLNGYAGLWSRAIMWDLQRVIMDVVARRAEAEARR
jgi:hypothetical protein